MSNSTFEGDNVNIHINIDNEEDAIDLEKAAAVQKAFENFDGKE